MMTIGKLRPTATLTMTISDEKTTVNPETVTTEIADGGGFREILKNQTFLVLWGGQIFSQLADKVYLVLMIALIAAHFPDATEDISQWVSGIMIAFTIPAVLFGSLAGVYVDRWSKKWVLVGSNLVRGGLVLALPLVLSLIPEQRLLFQWPLGFWVLLAITFLVSTLTQFFAPAEQSAITLIVERQNLLAANSLYTTTMMALVIIGFAIGDPLLDGAEQWLRSLGMATNIGRELVVGGAYGGAGLLLLALVTGEKAQHQAPSDRHIVQDLKEGLQYLRHHRKVRNALVQLIILFSIFAALAVLAVSLANQIPQLQAEQFGFLLAAGGVGMAIGAFLLGHGGQKFSHLQLGLIGSLGMAIALGVLAFGIHNLVLSLAMIALLGIFAAFVGIPMQTTIQAETPPEMRGKVFGLQNNAVNIALSLPLALAGVAETLFGLTPVLLTLAALAIAGGILTWLLTRTPVKTQMS